MRVIIFGATGMVGQGVLLECLRDPDVSGVLAVGRTPTGRADPKLRELQHSDFTDFSVVADEFAGYDACFFCLGISSVGMKEADYRRITYDYALAAADAILARSPDLTFCFVSGVGTDSASRTMWARVKGETEDALLARSPRAHMFRPGYLQPVHGVRSKTRLYSAAYRVIAPLYPVLRRIIPRNVSTTANVGRAMLAVARGVGAENRVLTSVDFNALAEPGADRRGSGRVEP